jgi:hypothetical protein
MYREGTDLAGTRTKAVKTGLTASQERVLLALLSTPTHEAASRQAGITSRTLRRYLQLPAFRDEYLQRRRELMSQAIALAQQYATSMVAVQISIARDVNVPPSVRVSAANNVYNIGDAGQRTEDLTSRVLALEEMINEFNVTNIKGSRNGKLAVRVGR